jgi:hypothetical protein
MERSSEDHQADGRHDHDKNGADDEGPVVVPPLLAPDLFVALTWGELRWIIHGSPLEHWTVANPTIVRFSPYKVNVA